MIRLVRRRRRSEAEQPGVDSALAGMRVKREVTVRQLVIGGLGSDDDVIAVYLRDRGVLICREHAIEPTALHTIASVGSPDLVAVLLTGTPKAQRLLRPRCLRCELDSNGEAVQ